MAKPGPVRPFHALAALALVGSMGASAFGLTAFPDPSPDGDCPCPCHKKQAKAPPPKLDRLLLRTDVDDRWVVPGDTDEIRKAWIRFGDEEEVLLDFTRGKADADHLLRSVSDLRAQIAALEKQLAELTAIREHVDPRELLDRDLWEVEEAEPRGFWSTRRPSAKQDEERDPKVERYWRVGGERRAQERRPARRRVEGRRLPERVREFQFKEQDELLKQAKKVREEALKQGETKRRYLELKVQYDAESGILEVKPHLEALDFYRQKAPGGEGEARPPRTKRYHRRFFQRDEPEGESPFVYFGDEGERPGWYRYEGTADGDTILDLTNEIQVDGDHVLHPEQLESIRVQVLDLLKPLQNIEFDFDEDFEGFELDENVIRVLLEDANEHVIKALKAKDGNLILEIKRDQKPR